MFDRQEIIEKFQTFFTVLIIRTSFIADGKKSLLGPGKV